MISEAALSEALQRVVGDGSPEMVERARRTIAKRAREPYWSWRALPAGAQRAYLDLLRTHKGQSATHVLLGGNRSGKSEVGGWASRRMMIDLAPKIRELRNRGLPAVFWCVAPQYEHAGQIQWKQKLSRFVHPRDIEGVSWRNKTKGHPELVRLRSGLDIMFKSADQGRDAFQGEAVLGVWADEQIPEDVREEIAMRCLDYSASMLYTFTPIDPDPDMQARYENPPDGWTFHQITIDDNRQSRGGMLPDLAVDRILAQLKEENPDLFETRRAGAFAALRGMVFKSFGRDKNVVSGDKMRAIIRSRRSRLRLYVGVDFGIQNPFAAVFCAYDPDTREWFIFAEHHQADRTIEHHMGAMRRILGEWGIAMGEVRAFYCDPGDQSKAEEGEDFRKSGRKAMAAAGFPVRNANKSWWPSVMLLQTLMGRKALIHSDGTIVMGDPRLLISAECVCLCREITGYRYDDKSSGDRDPKDAKPFKQNDHGVDGMRYGIHTATLDMEVEGIKPVGIGEIQTTVG